MPPPLSFLEKEEEEDQKLEWSRDGDKKGENFRSKFSIVLADRERAYGWPSIKRNAKRGIDQWDKDGSGCTVLGLGIMAVIMRSATSFLIVSR